MKADKEPIRKRTSSKQITHNTTTKTSLKIKFDFDEEIIQTPYERSLKILKRLQEYLSVRKEVELLNDLKWVIDIISCNNLYKYDYPQDYTKSTFKKNQHILEYLKEYSESSKDYMKNLNRNQILLYGDQKLPKNKTTSFLATKPSSHILSQNIKLKVPVHKASLFDLQVDDDSSNEELENIKESKFVIKEVSFNEYLKDQDLILCKDFDMLNYFESRSGGNAFFSVACTLFNDLRLVEVIRKDKLEAFLNQVRSSYNSGNPYHNEKHGLDVFHSSFVQYKYGQARELLNLTQLDILAISIAALCHDIGHPGFTNNFHINSISDFALEYNDKSVLENFHISKTFKILLSQNTLIVEKLDHIQFALLRKRIIEAILSTDMTFHARLVSIVKNRLIDRDITAGRNLDLLVKNDDTCFQEQQDYINFQLHLADISHNIKPFDISYKWVKLLMNEFWNQGDLEKQMKLPVSFLCNRETTQICQSQVGFLKGIVRPSFEVMVEYLPDLKYFLDRISDNTENWIKESSNEHEDFINLRSYTDKIKPKQTKIFDMLNQQQASEKLEFSMHIQKLKSM